MKRSENDEIVYVGTLYKNQPSTCGNCANIKNNTKIYLKLLKIISYFIGRRRSTTKIFQAIYYLLLLTILLLANASIEPLQIEDTGKIIRRQIDRGIIRKQRNTGEEDVRKEK